MNYEFDDEGIVRLRDAIIIRACDDYVKSKKFLLRNPNPDLISKKNEIHGVKWNAIRRAFDKGEITKEELEHFKNERSRTLFKRAYERAEFYVKDITWWFGSKQFISFNLELERDDMVKRLNQRALDEIEEENKRKKEKN